MSERDRILLVGGASGIGAACVERLAASGASVVCADLEAPAPGAPLDASAQVDVRDADAVDAAIAMLADGRSLDGMVYSAGIGHVSPFEEIASARWRLVLDVNLTGAYHCARSALRHMTRGAFVLISSIDSLSPVPGLSHYCASKAGLEALNRSLALELAPRIRSNVVAPGPVRTPLMDDVYSDPAREMEFVSRIPMGSIAVPEQIADAVAFLLSPAAGHITGARLAVDGGMSLREHPSMLTTERGTE